MSEDEDELHISVTNQGFPDETYETNLTYSKLSSPLKRLFTSLMHLYSEIQKGEMNIYFHDVIPSVRIGVKIGEEYK